MVKAALLDLSRLFQHDLLRRGAIGAVAALVLMAALLAGPWSPLALDRVDRAVVAGDGLHARARAERVIRWGLTPGIRNGARYRAALAETTLLGEHAAAVAHLEALLERARPRHPLRAQALQLLAGTLDLHQGDPAGAAARYQELADLGADREHWLLVAAEAWERAGDVNRAQVLRGRVATGGGSLAAAAWLAMGRTRLGMGDPARAYDHYLQATEIPGPPEDARLARLGMAMALDALGDVGLAVAELDEASEEGGADPVLEITRERLIRRAGEATLH